MLKNLRRLFEAEEPHRELPGFERRHLRLSVAVLLHEARRADYAQQDEESAEAEAALRELFGVGGAEAAHLMKEGRARAESLSSFYAPLTVVKRDFSMPERIRLIEHLLYVPNTDSMLARNRAKAR